MGLEDLTGASKYIDDLVNTNPVGSTDTKSTLDDHIRGIKNVLLNSFPSVTGPVSFTQGEANVLAGVTAGTAAASKAVVLDASKNVSTINQLDVTTLQIGGVSLTPTAAELNYVSGVTSAIQTQLDAKADIAGAETVSGLWNYTTAPTIGGKAVARSDNAETISALWDFTTEPTINSNAAWHEGNRFFKIKTADETVNNSNTYQDDDHFASISLEANTFYKVSAVIFLDGNSTADFKVKFVFSNAEQWSRLSYVFDSSTTDAIMGYLASMSTGIGINNPAASSVLYLECSLYSNAATGGTLKLQWAQSTADASNLTFKKGSWMEIIKLGS